MRVSTLACALYALTVHATTTQLREPVYVGDSLICNDLNCYPKVFEAREDWKIVLPQQQLPAGLDIRVNLDTGLKEARLLPNDGSVQETSLPVTTGSTSYQQSAQATMESTTDLPQKTSIANDLVMKESPPPASKEPATVKDLVVKEIPGDTTTTPTSAAPSATANAVDPDQDYEFKNDFAVVKQLINKPELSESDFDTLDAKLDDLIEFAHDFKHGLKIVTFEFQTLQKISFNETYPIATRDLATRIITGCIRNNPPVATFINENHTEYVDLLQDWFKQLSKRDPKEINDEKLLIKRYISILDVLSDNDSSINLTKSQLNSLKVVFDSLSDKQIKIKILEFNSRFFSHPSMPHLMKRDEFSMQSVQTWADEFAKTIQDDTIDELHFRKMFNSLHNIKSSFKQEIKLNDDFLSWLAEEAHRRRKTLGGSQAGKDDEQDAFDRKLLESRHLIFGNPMAHQIKHDEL